MLFLLKSFFIVSCQSNPFTSKPIQSYQTQKLVKLILVIDQQTKVGSYHVPVHDEHCEVILMSVKPNQLMTNIYMHVS